MLIHGNNVGKLSQSAKVHQGNYPVWTSISVFPLEEVPEAAVSYLEPLDLLSALCKMHFGLDTQSSQLSGMQSVHSAR